MGNHGTKIQWTHFPGYQGETWNPVTGCSHISPGCDNCYAERISKRFRKPWGVPIFHMGRLDQPSRWKKSRAIFVCSMSDLFHREVPDSFIWAVMQRAVDNPRHLFLILTKRPQKMYGFFDRFGSLHNLLIGVTVENNDYRHRVDTLRQIPAAHKFISFEPLLSDIPDVDLTGIDWCIAGGESGPGARPMHLDWARSLRDQCQEAGVPFFFKQHGEYLHESQLADAVTEEINWDESHFDPLGFCRCGKKAAGRLLDGREWNEFPEVSNNGNS